jgi:hypothetical protein
MLNSTHLVIALLPAILNFLVIMEAEEVYGNHQVE